MYKQIKNYLHIISLGIQNKLAKAKAQKNRFVFLLLLLLLLFVVVVVVVVNMSDCDCGRQLEALVAATAAVGPLVPLCSCQRCLRQSPLGVSRGSGSSRGRGHLKIPRRFGAMRYAF